MQSEINFLPIKDSSSIKVAIGNFSVKFWLILFGLFAGCAVVILFTKVFIFGLVPIFIFFIELADVLKHQKSRALYNFALANNWNMTSPDDPNIVPPTLAGIGHSRFISEIIEGYYNNTNFRLFSYQYKVGVGKNQQTFVFTIFQIILEKKFPSLLLDAKATSGAKRRLQNYDHISLEGDFDKYFHLYAPKENRVDVLSVITPDVMSALVSYNKKQDIEILGNQLWFISTEDKINYQDLPVLFSSLSQVLKELKHKSKSYNATLVHDPKEITLSDKSTKNIRYSFSDGEIVLIQVLIGISLAVVIFVLQANL